ncbi:helix-turn-helix transcriptional regulator [Erysipelothrix rhusiopathiae]|uniref:helix-turn-helix domain-containing protein n=1 Tax=Erysipelothrix rhusiopathiae TaxID=1648 RepID=UPI000F455CAB|nr:helix-turn-helix transcriptional regulator [Erysipelothrix rhusiopathiae]MDE8193499.1 helix-turn-helix transcriptional regulator [Erysipelothrix rhusiopathiae]MDE8200966.1 helix-turn-helix transcriptional regulator [Erysipelothrix rhusiopathiae]MDE8226555.1 helix-turn-helix transcriptional regulator [Erysipelothrix rhusiopathiae]MDE8229967.1 helix-turn-helix transcriptional regulator [Erysipelothrix rhusiopathiae]MDE8241760.1 helix-turn-helix transcriptional regulator [Erysipelothrix rhusio
MCKTITEKRIRELMKKNSWSLGDLSEKTNIPKTTLHRYLNDSSIIPLDRLSILSDTLNTTPEYLLGWEINTEDSTSDNDTETFSFISDKPELFDIYRQIHDNEQLQQLFNISKDLTPIDLETVLMVARGIKKERGQE